MASEDRAGAGGGAGLEWLNTLAREDAVARLLACCGSERWAARVADRRPFADERQLFEAAEQIWWRLGREDWLAAFRSHPKIGEREAARETGEEASRWSREEQAGVGGAPPETAGAIESGNREYEKHFGYIFIICATGKTPGEMLDALRRRLSNDPATELCVAAEEQRRITRLRLVKLLAEITSEE